MGTRTLHIEIDDGAAATLEERARSRGISLGELLAETAQAEPDWSANIEAMRRESRGPWSPEAIAADIRTVEDYERNGKAIPFEEVKAWMKSWGTDGERPMPKSRKR